MRDLWNPMINIPRQWYWVTDVHLHTGLPLSICPLALFRLEKNLCSLNCDLKKPSLTWTLQQQDSCEITQVQLSGPTVRATASRRVGGSAGRIGEELYRSLRRPEAGSQSPAAPTAEAESVSCLSSSGSAGTGTAVRRRPGRWLPQVSWCHSPEEQASLNVNNMSLKKTFGIQFGCEVLPYKRFQKDSGFFFAAFGSLIWLCNT